MANDANEWAGLQDNVSLRIDGETHKQYETFGGDGFFAAVLERKAKVAAPVVDQIVVAEPQSED